MICKKGHIDCRDASGRCKQCCKDRRSTPEQILKNHKKYLAKRSEKIAYAKQWVLKNPEKFKITQKKAYIKNFKQKQAYQAKYRLENAEKMESFRKAWADAHPEKIRAAVRNRRARKRAATGFHTGEDEKCLWDLQNGLCGHCREILKKGKEAHLDHIYPLELGGTNWPSNLQWLCRFCNDSKGFKDPREFVRQTGKMFMCWAA